MWTEKLNRALPLLNGAVIGVSGIEGPRGPVTSS